MATRRKTKKEKLPKCSQCGASFGTFCVPCEEALDRAANEGK